MGSTDTGFLTGQFNEAVLHTFFLRRRLAATIGGHSLDCVPPCLDVFCQCHRDSRRRKFYAARFNFQSLLATQRLPGGAIYAQHSLPEWEAAVAILRAVEASGQLDTSDTQFYSTCSDNPIFNDIPTAILSAAVASQWGTQCLSSAEHDLWIEHSQVQPASFWVALCACVLGDLRLLGLYTHELAIPVKTSPALGLTPPSIDIQLRDLLKVAIRRTKLSVVARLLEQYPNIISGTQESNCTCLQAAIFSGSNEVLEALLEYTPNRPDLLITALSHYQTLLPRSSSGSETIRLLTRHFAPLPTRARTWLIMHSCAVGDVSLLKDFLRTGPLFDDRIHDAGGRIPTYMNFAVRCDNLDCFRFLLDQGVVIDQHRHSWELVTEQALSYNQIECYRELYRRIPYDEWNSPGSARFFIQLTSAENTEELMAEFIRKEPLILEHVWDSVDGPQPTMAQRALWNALQRLRPGNVKFLLEIGVRPFPWKSLKMPEKSHGPGHYSHDPFEIQWPHFNVNRDAFRSVQNLLEAFYLPKLRLKV